MHPYFVLLGFQIPAYGIFMASAICISVGLIVHRFHAKGGDANNALIIAAFALIFALLGGHLLYLLASYGISNIIQDIKSGNYSFLSSGGLVYYGGLICGIVGAFVGVKVVHEVKLSLFIQSAIPCIPLGHAIGRVGCFFGGCCYGLPYHGFGAVRLIDTDIHATVFPIQLVESVANLLLFVRLLHLSKRNRSQLYPLYFYLFYYSMIRFILEFFRGDMIRGSALGLSTSQWISFLLFCISTPLVIKERRLSQNGE